MSTAVPAVMANATFRAGAAQAWVIKIAHNVVAPEKSLVSCASVVNGSTVVVAVGGAIGLNKSRSRFGTIQPAVMTPHTVLSTDPAWLVTLQGKYPVSVVITTAKSTVEPAVPVEKSAAIHVEPQEKLIAPLAMPKVFCMSGALLMPTLSEMKHYMKMLKMIILSN